MKHILKTDMAYAAFLALGIEVGIVCTLIWTISRIHHPATITATPVILRFPITPTHHKPVPKPIIKPTPIPQKTVHHAAPPTPTPKLPIPVATAAPLPLPTPPSVPAPTISPPKPVASASSPVPPPAPVPPNPQIRLLFQDKVLGAVQAAVHYPFAARTAHMQGRTRIHFDYLDGTVRNITVVHSSGYQILDQSAVQAVLNAQYPQTPAEFRHKNLVMALWVIHQLHEDE